MKRTVSVLVLLLCVATALQTTGCAGLLWNMEAQQSNRDRVLNVITLARMGFDIGVVIAERYGANAETLAVIKANADSAFTLMQAVAKVDLTQTDKEGLIESLKLIRIAFREIEILCRLNGASDVSLQIVHDRGEDLFAVLETFIAGMQ